MGRGGFVRVAGGGMAVLGGSGVSVRGAYCSLLERKELRDAQQRSCCSVKLHLRYTDHLSSSEEDGRSADRQVDMRT